MSHPHFFAKGFQSRSFQSFQEALERGEAKHLMPVMNAKQRVAKGELRKEDIPVSTREEIHSPGLRLFMSMPSFLTTMRTSMS